MLSQLQSYVKMLNMPYEYTSQLAKALLIDWGESTLMTTEPSSYELCTYRMQSFPISHSRFDCMLTKLQELCSV